MEQNNQTNSIFPMGLVKKAYEADLAAKEAKAEADALRKQVEEILRANGINNYTEDNILVTLGADTDILDFDFTKFKKEHVEEFNRLMEEFSAFQKNTHRKGSLKLTENLVDTKHLNN